MDMVGGEAVVMEAVSYEWREYNWKVRYEEHVWFAGPSYACSGWPGGYSNNNVIDGAVCGHWSVVWTSTGRHLE